MLTPTDIQNKRFDKAMSGYKTEDVNAFLSDVAEQMEALAEEKEDLQHKLEILAEKVEQYREDEDSLRAALIGAQKLGDSVVRDAKRKAETIIAQATRKAEEIVSEAQASINRETLALNKMQMKVARFKGQILSLYKQHISLIQEIPDYDDKAAPGADKADSVFVASIGETVEVKPQEEDAPKQEKPSDAAKLPEPQEETGQETLYEAENAGKDEKEEQIPDNDGKPKTYRSFGDGANEAVDEFDGSDAFPKRRSSSRFGTLRFGDAYDLTRKD